MKIIVGLGNPGEKYKNIRHNVGFMILDEIVNKKGLFWEFSPKFESEIVIDGDIMFVKPQTYMNNSGNAVSKIVNFYKLNLEDLTVVHDDVDLPLGSFKKQIDKNSAGHRGVEDIIEKLGSKNFWRLRVGIGKPEDKNIPVDEWVLQDFSEDEVKKIIGLDLELL